MQMEYGGSDCPRSLCTVGYRQEVSFDPEAESYCTTGEFAHVDNGRYRRHCGPTAVTNAVRTLLTENTSAVPDADQVFRQAVQIGQKYFAYWNADLFGHLGGTSDFLVPLYLRQCLRANGLNRYHVRGPFPATRRLMGRAVGKGAILYLEMHFHPKYGNHHLLVYGYGRDDRGRLCWKTADGWKPEPVYLPAGEVGLGLFLVIS